MRSVRGRFDIVVPYSGGAYLRITSPKEKSLSKEEIVAALRRYADLLEKPAAPQEASGG